jgi:hypothetical protein
LTAVATGEAAEREREGYVTCIGFSTARGAAMISTLNVWGGKLLSLYAGRMSQAGRWHNSSAAHSSGNSVTLASNRAC